MSDCDLSWAAGFLEGEGSFFRQTRGDIVVKATQVNREPLERLKAMFGGSITYDDRRRDKGTRRPQWQWRLDGQRALRLMETIHPLMSAVRQEQIEIVLQALLPPEVIGEGYESPPSKLCI